MDLRNLRHAVALAAERNFARAAEKLHITQPALSRSIQALEQEFGVQLFNRERSGVTLTVIGSALIGRAEDLLRRARGLEQEVSRLRALEAGELKFGLAPLPAALFLAPLLAELHRGHPRLQLNVDLSGGPRLLQQLLAEHIEFFVCDEKQMPPADGLVREYLRDAAFSLFARRGHPLAVRGERLSRADLAGWTIAAGSLADASVAALRQWFGVDSDAALPIAIQCNDQAALKALLLSSDALLLTARDIVGADIAAGAIVELPVENADQLRASLSVFALDGRSLSPGAQLALEKLRGWSDIVAA